MRWDRGIFNGAYGDGSKPVLLEWFIYGESSLKMALQGGAPPSYKWVIIPLTIDITPINHSYWTYLHQLS